MLNNVLDNLRTDRAKFAREVEYLRETAIDDVLDERMESASALYARESYESLTEAADILDKMSIDDEIAKEAEEIDRILTADGNITFNEMVGIE